MREEDLGCGEGDENERKSEMRVPNPSSSFYTQRQKSGLAGPTGPRPFSVAGLLVCRCGKSTYRGGRVKMSAAVNHLPQRANPLP